MFCDLVGSTAISSRLDPEDLREVFGKYHKDVATVVGRFDGFVAKYMPTRRRPTYSWTETSRPMSAACWKWQMPGSIRSGPV